MIFDCFTFYNETTLLDFRLHHVYPHVDKIVIIESDRNYAGEPVESQYLKNIHRYEWAKDKIIHKITTLKENPSSRWENEALQRDSVMTAITPEPDDMIFFSCVDEIIDPGFYAYKFPEPHCLSLDNYYYYFNGRDVGEKPDHPMPIVFQYKDFTGSLHAMWEQRHTWQTVESAGWHFSYLGGTEAIKEKLKAYSHAENDTDEVRDNLEANIKAGKDIFGRPDHKFEFVEIDNSFPDYLVQNQFKYGGYIWKK